MDRASTLRPAARRAVRIVGYWFIAATAPLWRRRTTATPSSPIRSILVIRLDLLGDVLFSMQAVQGLRAAHPKARIVMLTLPYTASLAKLYPEVDEVIAVDTNRIRRPSGLLNPATWITYGRVVARLRAQEFDVALSLSGPMASLWAGLSGARSTIGFAGEGYPRMLVDRVPGGRYAERKHEVEYVRSLARRAGASQFPLTLGVPIDRVAAARVDALLRRSGVGPTARLVLVHAGSVNGSAKRWPAVHWSEFADAMQAPGDVRVALIGAQSDLSIAQEVLAGTSSDVLNLVGETSIEELVALIARADLVATGDSGPLHLAVALGRPLLGVYGPTDPNINGPFHPRAPVAIHRRDLVCSPCYTMAASAECPLGDPICMRLVSVREMVQSARELLESATSATGPEHEFLVTQQDALKDAEGSQGGDQ